MSQGTTIAIILGVLFLILVIIVALFLIWYFYLRTPTPPSPPSPPTPPPSPCGTLINGEQCSDNSDCVSCSCSLGYCQNQGTTTGLVGATCGQNGSQPVCSSGLSCSTSTLTCVAEPLLSNGSVCTSNSQCSSNNCSPFNNSVSYCQAPGVISGDLNSTCSDDSTCDSGLACDNGSCQLDTLNRTAWGGACSSDSDCVADQQCLIFNGSGHCSYPILPSDGPFELPEGLFCQPNMTNSNGSCLANNNNNPTGSIGNQMCNVSTQCLSGNCDSSKPGLWTFLTSGISDPSWIYLSNFPGLPSKLVSYNQSSSGIDWLMALIPAGTAGAGLYRYNTVSRCSQKILSNPTSNVIPSQSLTIQSFAISRDGAELIVAAAGSKGNVQSAIQTLESGNSFPVLSNVPYTGFYRLTLGEGGSIRSTNIFCSPGTEAPASTGVCTGTDLGKYTSFKQYPIGALAGPVTKEEFLLMYPSAYVDLDPTDINPLWGMPVNRVFDMDLDADNNLMLVASNYIPPNTFTANNINFPRSAGCFMPYYMYKNGCPAKSTKPYPSNAIGYPLNQPLNPVWTSVFGANAQDGCTASFDPQYGLENTNCGLDSPSHYIYSAKLLRALPVPSGKSYTCSGRGAIQEATYAPFQYYDFVPTIPSGIGLQSYCMFSNYACLTTCFQNLTLERCAGNQAVAVPISLPAIIAPINVSYATNFLVANNVLTNFSQATSGWKSQAGPDDIAGFYPAYSNWQNNPTNISILDYDVTNNTTPACVIFAYNISEKNYVMLYTANMTNGQQLVNLPGYFPSNGRVTISNQAIYFVGSGQCAPSGTTLPSAPSCVS